MKTKYTFILIYLSLLFAASCTKKTETKFSSIEPEINLMANPQKIKTDTMLNITPTWPLIIDSLLIVSSAYKEAGEDYYYCFNKNTFEFLFSFGIKGKGPKEIAMALATSYNKKRKSILVLDYGKRKIWEFKLDSLLKNNNLLPGLYFDLPDEWEEIFEITAWGDTLVMDGGRGNDLIRIVYNNKKDVKVFGKEHVKKEKQQMERTYSQTLRKQMSVNYKHKALAIGYFYYDRLTLMNHKGEIEWTLTGPDHFVPQFIGSAQLNSKMGYAEIKTYGDYIFGLYMGKPLGYFKNMKHIENYPEYLHVFDIKGNIIGRFHLDHQIVNFAIDEENKRIIGIIKDEEPFVYFDLNLKQLIKYKH